MHLADLIRRMAAAGAPAEAIAIAIEAVEAAEERRKAPARERKQRQRAAARDLHTEGQGQSQEDSATVTGQGRDTPFPSPPNENNLTPPAHTPVKNNSRVRGTRLAADFELPADWRDWAISEGGLTPAHADDEGEAFRDYWHAKAGKDAVKTDWLATWRNWVRRAKPKHPPPRSSGRQPQQQWEGFC